MECGRSPQQRPCYRKVGSFSPREIKHASGAAWEANVYVLRPFADLAGGFLFVRPLKEQEFL